MKGKRIDFFLPLQFQRGERYDLIFETDLKMPLGLVIGSEGTGMRDLIRKNCDLLLRIPMAGKLDSLNASVSAGVFLYEIFRQKNTTV